MLNLSTTNNTINNSYQNSPENQNIEKQLSNNINIINSNPFILSNYEINNNSISSPKLENLKLKLIEKDKIIFDYMKKEKGYIKLIEDLKSTLKEKEDEIIKIQQEIKELEFKFSKKENILNIKNDEYSQISEKKENLIIDLKKENNDLNNQLINLKNVLKTYEDSKINYFEENQKNSNKIGELIIQITKNENLLKNLKKNENILKEENKQIPALKSKIADLENILKEYQNKIVELKNNNTQIINDKEELNKIINTKTAEIQQKKNDEQHIIRLNYKINYLSNELNTKKIENENINNKYSLLLKDIDIFINIFINELNNFLNYLEGLNIYSKTLHKLPPGTLPNFENINIDQDFNRKYDIFGKVIYLIKEKIVNILNKNIEKNQNILIDFANKENNYKLVLEEKDEIIKNKNDLDNVILNTNDRIQKYKLELQKFQKDYNKLKSDLIKMQDLNKDYILKNKILNNNFNDFVDDIKNQLRDFPYNNRINKNNTKNKIISQINSLIMLNKELNNEIKNLEKENRGYKLELDQTLKDNKNLKNKLHSISNSKELENKINILKNNDENEFLNQKKLLYDKINKLNDLLEESNHIIKTYEKETIELKSKNKKLENNLKLLTYSHHELEKIINSSSSGLKAEIDIKDQKYNDLLKELQLKDIHIKSLENLFSKENKPDIGHIFTKINAIPVNINNNNNDENKEEDGLNTTFNMNKNNDIIENDVGKNINEQSFSRDEITEMKLNKLINNYEIRNKINNFNHDKVNYNKNFNDEIRTNYVELKDLIEQNRGELENKTNINQNYIINENI